MSVSVPSIPVMSAEGNQSRIEHIQTERSLKGMPIDQFNAALFGPRLERTKAAFAVSIRPDTIGGVPVLVYEPKAGIAKANRGKVLINVHGGGFVGCFTECGGLESIPIAALTGIRVISIVGRFLEHSRIFYFGSGQPDALDGSWYMGSADWMSRNLDGRVEASCPVLDLSARKKLLRILQVMGEDRRNCWILQPDGSYTRLSPSPNAMPESTELVGTFTTMMRDTLAGGGGGAG